MQNILKSLKIQHYKGYVTLGDGQVIHDNIFPVKN